MTKEKVKIFERLRETLGSRLGIAKSHVDEQIEQDLSFWKSSFQQAIELSSFVVQIDGNSDPIMIGFYWNQNALLDIKKRHPKTKIYWFIGHDLRFLSDHLEMCFESE
ncbi:MAG: hypothetical protein MI748_16855, partial [Opitutales bacterium]|nr:hypothetical protein [Opitutales bacterium]